MISKLMIQEVKDILKNYSELHAELKERRAQLSEERYKQAGVSGVSMGENIPTVSISEHVKLLDNLVKIDALERRIKDIEERLHFANDILQYIGINQPEVYETIKAVYFDGLRYDEYAEQIGRSTRSLKEDVNRSIAVALRTKYRI